MDLGLIAAIAMLVLWAAGTFLFDAPGAIHLLLTVGVFLIVQRTITKVGTEKRAGGSR